MRCMLYGQQMEDKLVNHDYESLLKQILAYNVLKNAVLRCSVEKYGEKIIDLRILLELVNNILTLHRVHEFDMASETKSNPEFNAG